MKQLIPSVVLALSLQGAVFADPLLFPGLEPHKEVKLRFKDKHPKLYKVYRVGRHICICAQPFLNAAGSAAQIVLVFL